MPMSTARFTSKSRGQPATGMKTCRLASKGFTLLELLVAITVTALIGVGVWQLLGNTLRSQEVLERQSQSLQDLQRLILFLDRDFQQISSRVIRNEFGDHDYTLSTRNALYQIEFVRTGWRNPLKYKRSELQRVAYALEGETLLRLNWQVLDRAQDSEPKSRELATGVESIQFQFLTEENNWVDEWPQDSVLGSDDKARYKTLPRAIKVEFQHRVYGSLYRIYDLPKTVALQKDSNAGAGGETGGTGEGTGDNKGNESLEGGDSASDNSNEESKVENNDS